MEIKLSQAPDFLFDKQLWAEFCGRFQSPVIALTQISILPFYRPARFHAPDDPSLPAAGPERTTYIQKTYEIGWELITDLYSKLIAGEITATGIPFHREERKSIDPQAFRRLWLEFVNERAMGTGPGGPGRFEEVLLRLNTDPTVIAAVAKRNLVLWLQEEAAAGHTLKKSLFAAAQERFGSVVTTRVFNDAYQEVFRHLRGRPRRP